MERNESTSVKASKHSEIKTSKDAGSTLDDISGNVRNHLFITIKIAHQNKHLKHKKDHMNYHNSIIFLNKYLIYKQFLSYFFNENFTLI